MGSTTYSSLVYIIAGISTSFNVLLIFLYFHCPLQSMRSYKYGFILTAIQDLLTSVCTAVLIPNLISRNSYLVIMATGWLSDTPYGQILLVLQFAMMCLSLLIVANSFFYRYIHVCKMDYASIYTSKKSIFIMCVANIVVLLNLATILVVCAWPSEDFRRQIYDERSSFDITKLEQKSFLGFSMQYSISQLTIILMIDGLLMMVLFALVQSFCGYRINSTLKELSVSDSMRDVHKNLFHVLLLQCACPMLFVYIPLCACLVILFASSHTGETVSDVIGISVLLYPLSNSIVTMICVKDYREFIASLVTRKR